MRHIKSETGSAGSNATRPAETGGSPASGASSAHHSAACATAPGLASRKPSINAQNPEPPFSPPEEGDTAPCSAPCRGRGEASACGVGGLREARRDAAASEHCRMPPGAGFGTVDQRPTEFASTVRRFGTDIGSQSEGRLACHASDFRRLPNR